jgi:hypothetical protein
MRISMTPRDTTYGSFSGFALRFSLWFRRLTPRTSRDEIVQGQLVHLAELSPHLLSDLGFELDRKTSAPGRQIWRKDEYFVTLYVPTAPVAV